jgi:predicted nucleic acid-binding Zn ribbon protein
MMHEAFPSEKTERAPSSASVLLSPEPARPVCPVCGAPLRGRQKSACSDKHRAELSRRTRAARRSARDAKIQAHAEAVLALVGSADGAAEAAGAHTRGR